MKIGILTYYGDLNCGTNLQAYATLCAVKEVFPHDDVEIIPFHGFRQYNHPYLSNCSLTSIIRDLKRMAKYDKFYKQRLNIRNDKTILAVDKALAYINNRNYDVIFVGADTLLELNRIPQTHKGLSAYWLSPNIKAQKALLAASSKNVEIHNLTQQQREEMELATKDYIAIGVRDTATQELLSNFVEKEKISVIPDPTFTLPINYEYVENYLKKRNIKLQEKCVCIHPYKTDEWPAEVANHLKAQGYQVVSFRPMAWADVVFNDMSPLEQAGIFRYFSLVITHRFHEGIYALKNNAPIILYVNHDTNLKTQTGDSKYKSLMDNFGLYPSNVIDNGEITASRFINQIPIALEKYYEDSDTIAQKIKQMRVQYIDFLHSTRELIEKKKRQ